jgi:hypothetical protein
MVTSVTRRDTEMDGDFCHQGSWDTEIAQTI